MNNTQTYLLVRYGEYPHVKGLQCFNKNAAEKLLSHFQSLRGRLRRCFGGVPVYIGHPDDPDFLNQPGHDDTRAHGWVQDLLVSDLGISVVIKWADTGLDMLKNAHFKFLSPRWAVEEVEPGILEPVKLISIGLTNNPNIPGETIANSRPPELDDMEDVPLGEVPVGLCERLNLSSPCNWEGVYDRLDALLASGEADLFQQAETFQRLAEDADARCRELEAKLESQLEPMANCINTKPESTGLKRRGEGRSFHLLETVHQRMQETGEDFMHAWGSLKRANPELFSLSN
jgi:hypothetical protein